MRILLPLSILIGTLFCASVPQYELAQSFECLGGIETFLYLGEEPYPESNPTPLPPWQYETDVQENAYSDLSDVVAARFRDSATEIWIFSAPNGFLSKPTEIVVYYPATGEKTKISTMTNLEGVQVDRLYVDDFGAVWGRNRLVNTLIGNPPDSKVPVLSKYDEVSKVFVVIENGPGIPGEYLWRGFVPEVYLDTESVFWVFMQEDGLFRFDSKNLQTSKTLDFPGIMVLPLYASAGGEIYFQSFEYESRIYKYSYTESTLEEVSMPDSGWYGSSTILVDRNQNLWLSGFGWRDPQGEWHSLHPKASEILSNPESFTAEERYSPRIVFESSNGWLWFAKYKEFDNGTAWFDPDTGESCWFTTLSKNVIEDNEGRIWISANGKLYSLDMYP